MYIPKIDDYLKILTGDKVKDFVAINFSEYFKFTVTTPNEVEKCAKMMQSNTSDDCVHRYNMMILNLFDPELQLINNKSMIKNKLQKLLSELKKFKIQTILFLEHKKRNDCKIFHSCTKLIARDSDTDEVFKSMDESIIAKIKNYACEDWILLDVITKHSIKIFEC